MFTEKTIAPAGEHTPNSTAGSWRWSQHWLDLIFAHWRVPEEKLMPHLPAGLELDTCEGTPWVSAIAFHLDRVRLRGLPAFGPWSSFFELNVRTYVRRHGQPAILFLRIYAGEPLAVALARCLTPLPYASARITYDRAPEAYRFRSSRRTRGISRPLFHALFATAADAEEELTDPLDIWLLERYCAYTADKRGRLYRMRVQHPPWKARRCSMDVAAQGLGTEWGLDLTGPPDRCHFSLGTRSLLWPFEEVRG